MRNRNGVLKVLVLFAASMLKEPEAQADDEDAPELITDRPDQTESSAVIQPGYVQIETGILYTEEEDHGEQSRTLEYPGTLLRIGLVNRLELRIGFTGWVSDLEGDDSDFGDSELGLKLYLAKEDGWRPESAFLASVSIPTGGDGLSSERLDPNFRFAFSHTLSDRISLGYNVGAAWETAEYAKSRSRVRSIAYDTVADAALVKLTDPALLGDSQLAASLVGVLLGESFDALDPGTGGTDRDTTSVFQYTITSGITLTDRLGMFIEFYGDIPMSAPGKPANYFDAGFTYLVQDNIQLDIAGGIGLSEDADDWFIGSGITFRFPR